MKPPKNTPVYRLIHSQQMVEYMWRYSLHMQSTQIPCAVLFEETMELSLLAAAVSEEIARNDCLRIRVFRQGRAKMQYFAAPYRPEDVPVKLFGSRAEMEAYFNADAAKKLNVFGGEVWRIVLVRACGGKTGVYLNVSHVCMDAMATVVFFKDLIAVYDALKNGAPLPPPLAKYEDIVKAEQNNAALEARIAASRSALADYVSAGGCPRFVMLDGGKTLQKQRRLLHNKNLRVPHVYLPLNDAARFVKRRLSAEQSETIDAYLAETGFSPEWLLQTGFRLAFAALNGCDNDMLFWVLCPRRRTLKEKRCGGTLASPMPWRETILPDTAFSEAVRRHGETQAFLFRHADVPFSEVRKIEQERFGFSLMQSANSMMFSYLPFTADVFGERKYEYLGFNFGHYVMPLYTVTMRDPESGRYVFSYIHRLSYSSDGDVTRFHALAVKAILTGIAAPDKTAAQIMEELQC